jgi:flavin reductase (DIM6/NTAB) family NADH-FMN oxidoreductase RutF
LPVTIRSSLRAPPKNPDVISPHFATGVGMTDTTSESVKALMRAFPQGVTLVISMYRGEPFGVTVSAFSSISLVPPLVMVSIGKGTKAHEALSQSERFTVNFLYSGQSSISERFAGRTQALRSRFDDLDVREGSDGCLFLADSIGHIECEKESSYEKGDHTIFIGRVLLASLHRDSPPLVYYKRRYTTVVEPATGSQAYDSLLGEW